MSDVEAALMAALESNPGDWSVRFLIADKMSERGAYDEAVHIVTSAPVAPDTEEKLRKMVEIAGSNAVPAVQAFLTTHPTSSYAHGVLATLLEHTGEIDRASQHRAVAAAMAAASGQVPEHQEPVEQYSEQAVEQHYEDATQPYSPIPPAPDLMVAVDSSDEGQEYYEAPPKQMGKKATAILVAVVVHLVIGVIAMLVVILPASKDEPEIVAAVIGPPAKKQEMQKKNVVKQTKKTSASSAAAAPLAQLMRANAVAKISLPNVTRTSKGPLGIGDADFGGGGFGSGGDGLGSGASFFGGTSTGKRFLFVLDHSRSMKNNQVELRDNELEKALKSLKGVQYQVMLFAGGNYYAQKGWSLNGGGGKDNVFTSPSGSYTYKRNEVTDYDFVGADSRIPKAEWIDSNAANVKKTMDFIKREKLFVGTDWGAALKMAHLMEPPPDVIFFMADGTGGNSPAPILSINSKNGKPPINMVAMQTTSGHKQFSEIAEKTKGSFTIVDKNGKPIDGFDYMSNPGKYRGRL